MGFLVAAYQPPTQALFRDPLLIKTPSGPEILHLAAKFVPSSARTGPAFRTSRQQAPRKLEQEALAALRELRDELRESSPQG